MNPSQPRLQAPTGACDCHMHIVYPVSRFPVAPDRQPFPEATVAAYRAVADRLGIERYIVTQTPRYGTDNRSVLAAIEALGPNARGTAAVDASVSQQDLDRLTTAGIRGAALHMLPGGWFDWDDVSTIAAKVMDVGWHLHVQLNGVEFADHIEQLQRLQNTLVIDHIGKFLEPVGTDHPGFRALLRLVDTGRCYVKLSAPYESAWGDPPYLEHSGALAMALIKAAPERMLWASNWPHLGVPDVAAKPDDGMLLDTLLRWADNAADRDAILSENPGRLYGFD